MILIHHVLYLIISIALTVWVAWTLHRHGRQFLVAAFAGDERMADSVNHLLVVGFYLVNLGFVALFLRFGTLPTTTDEAIVTLGTKVGVVLLVLGGMHFFNMFNFAKLRSKARRRQAEDEERALRMQRLNQAVSIA
jgi:cytochrome c biogenesis protein CcdA